MLRLVSATIGPVSAASGVSPSAQTVEAYNAGDGSLSLSVASSVPWITPTVGASRPCSTTANASTCIPLQFAFSTGSLPAGLSTGIVTVSDPNAVDAPQTITVTVQVGGGVPSTLDRYVAPGGSLDVTFATNSQVNGKVTTQDGGSWLSLALDGTGSFRFVFPYKIQFRPPASMAAGTYNGTVVTTGSSFPGDNKTIAVTMRVTTQPIAAQPDPIRIRLAQGAPPLVYPFSPFAGLTNLGQGTLTVSGVTPTGGSWLKVDQFNFLQIDPAGLSPGDNNGSLSIASNAVNGTITVPVTLTIVPKGPPSIFFQGVLDNATFIPGDTVSQGDIMVVKGEQLSFDPFTPGPAPPLPVKLGSTSVLVNGSPVPLFYTSYGQIAFQMPTNTPVGTAVVQVMRDDGSSSNKASVTVAARAPRLLVAVNQDGSINAAGAPAHAGDVLTIYAIGFGATSPSVPTGQPAPSTEPLARVTPDPLLTFGNGLFGVPATPLFAGLTPTYAGLYQLNVAVPAAAGKGAVPFSASFAAAGSNTLLIYIQ